MQQAANLAGLLTVVLKILVRGGFSVAKLRPCRILALDAVHRAQGDLPHVLGDVLLRVDVLHLIVLHSSRNI